MRILIISVLFLGLTTFSGAQEKTIEGRSMPGRLSIRFQPPSLSMTANFSDTNGNQALDAKESGLLRVIIANAGPGKAYDLRLRLSKQSGASFITLTKYSITLPILKPDEKRTLEFPLQAAFETPDGRLQLHLEASEKNKYPPAPLDITLETRAFIPPELIVADVGINDEQGANAYGNGNGKIEKGETVAVKAIVQNRGQEEAANVKAEVIFDESMLFYMGKREFVLGDLAAGEHREVSFSLTVPPDYSGSNELPVRIKISEARGRYGKTVTLALSLNRTARRTTELQPQQVTIAGRQRRAVEIAALPSLTVDVDVNIPKALRKNPNAVAVVIGNRNYQTGDVPAVDFALRDAAIVKEYLINALGYREENIIYLPNATRAQLVAAFGNENDYRGKLFNYLKPGQSDVFVYYSGHGAPDPQDKKAYLVPVDADPAFVRLNGYSLDTFYSNLGKLPARQVTVVLDACFSGASESGMLIKYASPVFINIDNPALAAKNCLVFSSSRGDQISSWYPEKKHGLFTYFFLKGLSGEADGNRDKKITASELNSYIQENVPYLARRLHNREQTPELLGQTNNTKKVVVELR